MTKKSPRQQYYLQAPIIEAAIDIRVIPAKDMNFSKLELAAREKFPQEYPLISRQFQNEFILKSGENPQVNPVTSHAGLRFTSENNKQILQIKEDGFTFSRLAPYENWEKFREEARRLWMIYQKATLPQHITRVAIRFINRFDFPGVAIELSDYLKVLPHVPESYLIKGFSMQAILGQEDINSTLIITQALIPPTKPETVSILLDFDLFNEELRSCEDNFWFFLDQLRIRKNKFFESSITDKTRKLIS
jgi:uncharacterized protein (TIGR04255 family)